MRSPRRGKPSLIVKVAQAVDDLGRRPRPIEAWDDLKEFSDKYADRLKDRLRSELQTVKS